MIRHLIAIIAETFRRRPSGRHVSTGPFISNDYDEMAGF